MSEHIRVSVIILNYNGIKLIPKLFKTLGVQTYKNFEVIFVDNNSNDGSIQKLEEILSKEIKNLNVKIIKNEKNLGYCKGNNLGAHYANNEFIVFLSNDTFLSPTWLEELVRVMDKYPTVAVAQSRLLEASADIVQADGLVMDIYGWCKSIIVEKNDAGVIEPFFAMGASIIVRRKAFIESGGFDPDVFNGDCDLSWRLRLYGYEVATALKSICYHYGSYTQKKIVKEYSGYFHGFKEKVRVSIKNYSLENLLRTIPITISLMIAQSTYMTVKRKNPRILLASIEALAWNLKYLKDTLVRRKKVQMSRRRSDSELEKRMIHYSLLIADFHRLINRHSGIIYYKWGVGMVVIEKDQRSNKHLTFA
jgi:hypothetical protein